MFGRLLKNQKAALWYVALVILLPSLTLVFLGLYTLWKNDWLIKVSLIWLACTLVGYAIYRLWNSSAPGTEDKHLSLSSAEDRNNQANSTDPTTGDSLSSEKISDEKQLENRLPARIAVRADWSKSEREIWQQALTSIETVLSPSPDWQHLPDLCLHMISLVADSYHNKDQSLSLQKTPVSLSDNKKIYTFTLPEILLVLSITSARYRQLLLDYIPFVDSINVSSLLSLYEKKDQLQTGAKWVNTARRTARFVNPLAAITAELKDHFTGQLFSNLSEQMQLDLKRMLLQELVQVSMDLYSGRLKSSQDELARFTSSTYHQDKANEAPVIEPLRIVLAGQTSSGKSSLVNALKRQLFAESDILPTTNNTTVYSLTLHQADTHNNESSHNIAVSDITPEHHAPLHLVDTVGLTENAQSLDAIATESLNADLLIWVARANQPARAADASLHKKLQSTLLEQSSRIAPPVMLVLTHIDQLSPKALWEPPYDLESDNKKASNIKMALTSCKQQIGLADDTPTIPVCLTDQHNAYNIELVAAQIMAMQADSARAQLNRRRLEKNKNGTNWRERWDQARNLGIVTGALVSRSVLKR